MKVFEGAAWPDALRRHSSVVTIGNFDGLHLGHQSLLHNARSHPGPRVVLTFDPHPARILYPEREHKRLMPKGDLAEQLPQYGIDDLWIVPFTAAFANISPGDFLDTYLGRPFGAHDIVAGHDFAFGKNRGGSLDLLRNWAQKKGSRVHVMPPLEIDGQTVSSRRLRQLVSDGDVQSVARLLGRPFYLRGPVVSGEARGRQMGFPTLNQKIENETLPALGVYASRTLINNVYHPSVTNVGIGPTFGGQVPKFETHVLDAFVPTPAGSIDVELWSRLRGEAKFSGAAELKKQIAADILAARAVVG